MHGRDGHRHGLELDPDSESKIWKTTGFVSRSGVLWPYSKTKLELNSKKRRTRVTQKILYLCLYLSFLR